MSAVTTFGTPRSQPRHELAQQAGLGLDKVPRPFTPSIYWHTDDVRGRHHRIEMQKSLSDLVASTMMADTTVIRSRLPSPPDRRFENRELVARDHHAPRDVEAPRVGNERAELPIQLAARDLDVPPVRRVLEKVPVRTQFLMEAAERHERLGMVVDRQVANDKLSPSRSQEVSGGQEEAIHRFAPRRARLEIREAALSAIRVFNDPMTKFSPRASSCS